MVTLIESHEFALLQVNNLSEEVLQHRMRWYHLPIVDGWVPDARFEQHWNTTGAELRERLRRDHKILIHCRGGLERAGMIAALLLVELGWQAEAAIKAVRDQRPGAIETREQAAYVHKRQRPNPDQRGTF